MTIIELLIKKVDCQLTCGDKKLVCVEGTEGEILFVVAHRKSLSKKGIKPPLYIGSDEAEACQVLVSEK